MTEKWQPYTIWYVPGISGFVPENGDIYASFYFPEDQKGMYTKMHPDPSKQSTAEVFEGIHQSTDAWSHEVNKSRRVSIAAKRSRPSRGSAAYCGMLSLSNEVAGDVDLEDGKISSHVSKDSIEQNPDRRTSMRRSSTTFELMKSMDLFGLSSEPSSRKSFVVEYERNTTMHCPMFVTVMLPPGRTLVKFIVNGDETFAIELPIQKSNEWDDRCRTMIPPSQDNTLTSLANYVDLPLSNEPLYNIPTPIFSVGPLKLISLGIRYERLHVS